MFDLIRLLVPVPLVPVAAVLTGAFCYAIVTLALRVVGQLDIRRRPATTSSSDPPSGAVRLPPTARAAALFAFVTACLTGVIASAPLVSFRLLGITAAILLLLTGTLILSHSRRAPWLLVTAVAVTCMFQMMCAFGAVRIAKEAHAAVRRIEEEKTDNRAEDAEWLRNVSLGTIAGGLLGLLLGALGTRMNRR